MIEQMLASYENLSLRLREESLSALISQFVGDHFWKAKGGSNAFGKRYGLLISYMKTPRPILQSRLPISSHATSPIFTDDFVDSILDRVASPVHVPPPSPEISDNADEDTCALWLASQEAILSMTSRSKSVDHYKVRSQLTCLVASISIYEGEDCPPIIDCGIHYHSTQILLSLLATIAPSFAEEFWLALHYGHDLCLEDENYEDGSTDAMSSFSYYEELIHEELREYGFQDLPRRSNTGTLSSIFAQPFPVSDSLVDIRSLKRRSADSALRCIAQMEAQHDMVRWKEAVGMLGSDGIGSS